MEALIVVAVLVLVFYILSGIRVVDQYRRGVILTFGRYTGSKQPGLRIIIPIV